MTSESTAHAHPDPRRNSRAVAAQRARTRIMRAARDQFGELGYERASLDQIGHQAGITRGAVLYHFQSKSELMSALLEPFIVRLDSELDRFETGTSSPRPRVVLGAVLDALLATRPAAELLARDISGRHALDLDDWFTASVDRIVRLLTVDHPDDAAARIRALSALGALVRPLVSLPGTLPETHRDTILAAAVNALRPARR